MKDIYRDAFNMSKIISTPPARDETAPPHQYILDDMMENKGKRTKTNIVRDSIYLCLILLKDTLEDESATYKLQKNAT